MMMLTDIEKIKIWSYDQRLALIRESILLQLTRDIVKKNSIVYDQRLARSPSLF